MLVQDYLIEQEEKDFLPFNTLSYDSPQTFYSSFLNSERFPHHEKQSPYFTLLCLKPSRSYTARSSANLYCWLQIVLISNIEKFNITKSKGLRTKD